MRVHRETNSTVAWAHSMSQSGMEHCVQCWMSQSAIIVTGKMVAASRSQTSVAGWPVSGRLSCAWGKSRDEGPAQSRNKDRKATVALTLRGGGEGRDRGTDPKLCNSSPLRLQCALSLSLITPLPAEAFLGHFAQNRTWPEGRKAFPAR